MGRPMKRRDFITLAGTLAALPLAARAQQGERVRHVGMLVGFDDPDIKVFPNELEKLGWSEGRNIRVDHLYAPAGTQVQALAKDLVTLQPDVIFSQSRPATAALQRATNTVPIVFCYVIDPIGAGFVESFPHPGGNLTGFVVYEPSVIGKWMEMLKEIAPQTTRVALLGNPKTAAYYEYLLHAAETAAWSLGVEPIATRIESDVADIERAIAAIASAPNASMVVAPDSTTNVNSDLIIRLAARYRLPAIYSNKFFVAAGGLMSYGVIAVEQYRQAALYVDRILRGAKPSDLPVQTPTKYETVVNLKTAKALGLTLPTGLLVAADEVIE
jgi:putative tryptophan/tyrosine transport system substrate-binding protein